MQLILVISPDAEVGKTVGSGLDAGWGRIWNCSSIKDALSIIGQQEPSAIVVDGRNDLPNQLAFVHRVKHELKMDHLSVLIFISNSEKSAAKSFPESGVDDFLTWPAAVPIISHKLRLLIDKYESKKIRKNHALNIADPADDGFLKSDTQYGNKSVADPFAPNRKTLIVPELHMHKAEEKTETSQQKGIDLPDDFFENSGIDLEKPSLASDPEMNMDDFSLSTVGRMTSVADSSSPALAAAAEKISQAHLDDMAAKILEKKLTQAARENIRKLIAREVRDEVKKLLPEIVSHVKKQLG
jgi:DNA-binding response OmpR family regulator